MLKVDINSTREIDKKSSHVGNDEGMSMTSSTALHTESKLTQRIGSLISAVSEGMFEREEIIAVALLSALCGQNTFLYGPPGTAKSLISRRIACAFSEPAYFEYLMNRFSTPEDVFGPVSIKALKEDRYTRKTDNYLPTAEFAFLDEIWKSSPAILNTLLTLINERIFRNGEVVEKASLKALIAASNETPESNQGLDALYDRFIVRVMVGPIEQSENFERLLCNRPTEAGMKIDRELAVKAEEWLEWQEQLHQVQLSPETITIIHLIREALAQQHDALKVYVSDRRWQRAAILLKAAAFFNGRSETNHSDALLLRHCIWTKEENRQAVISIVDKAVQEAGFNSDVNLAEIDFKKENLDKEINQELYYSSDLYKAVDLQGKSYFVEKVNTQIYGASELKIYIPAEWMKSKLKQNPFDRSLNKLGDYFCQFDGQGTCTIYDQWSRDIGKFQPKVLFHKGDKKQEINQRLVNSLASSVSEIRGQLISVLENVEAQRKGLEEKLVSRFVPSERTLLAVRGITEQADRLRLRINDCERLEALCK